MNFEKSIVSLLLIFLVFITGCSRNVLMDEQNSDLLNYDFKISDIKNIDKTLSIQRYSYSTNIDKKYVAVVTYQSENASMQQYLVNKDGVIDLAVPKDSNFVISLPANRTITYTWNMKNNLDNRVIQFENRSWVGIPMPISEQGKTGANYDRQNFYFKPLKSGDEEIVMRYEYQTEQKNEFFEISFNIKVQ